MIVRNFALNDLTTELYLHFRFKMFLSLIKIKLTKQEYKGIYALYDRYFFTKTTTLPLFLSGNAINEATGIGSDW